MMNFVLKMMNFVLQMMNVCTKTDILCIDLHPYSDRS